MPDVVLIEWMIEFSQAPILGGPLKEGAFNGKAQNQQRSLTDVDSILCQGSITLT